MVIQNAPIDRTLVYAKHRSIVDNDEWNVRKQNVVAVIARAVAHL